MEFCLKNTSITWGYVQTRRLVVAPAQHLAVYIYEPDPKLQAEVSNSEAQQAAEERARNVRSILHKVYHSSELTAAASAYLLYLNTIPSLIRVPAAAVQDPIKAIHVAIENPPIGIKNENVKVWWLCEATR